MERREQEIREGAGRKERGVGARRGRKGRSERGGRKGQSERGGRKGGTQKGEGERGEGGVGPRRNCVALCILPRAKRDNGFPF